MQIENICTKKTYTQNGVDKTIWLRCGTLRTTDNGKKFIELNHMPDTTLFVFAQEKKQDTQQAQGSDDINQSQPPF